MATVRRAPTARMTARRHCAAATGSMRRAIPIDGGALSERYMNFG